MIKEQKTTSRNGVFFSVMRGGLLEGKKNTRKEILKMISSNAVCIKILIEAMRFKNLRRKILVFVNLQIDTKPLYQI
jgi:hypothetical protein